MKTKKTVGDRAFSVASAKVWNDLPLSIKSENNFIKFKSVIKTRYFRYGFDS